MSWSTPLITAVSTDFSIPSGVLNLSTVFKATITAIEDDLAALTTDVGLISADVVLINETLYTPVTGLDFVVPANTAAILALGADITTLGNKTITLSPPSFLSVTGSPITLNTGGTFTLGYSGSALPVANGGTGLTAIGAANTVLFSNGTVTSWNTSTGTGSNVLSTNPTITSVTITSATAATPAITLTHTATTSLTFQTWFASALANNTVATKRTGVNGTAGNYYDERFNYVSSASPTNNYTLNVNATSFFRINFSTTTPFEFINPSGPVSIGAGGLTISTPLGTSSGGTGLSTVGTSGQYLSSNGTSLVWVNPSAGSGSVTSVSLAVDSSLSGLFTNTGTGTITTLGTFTLTQAASPTITIATANQFNVSKTVGSSTIPNLNINFGSGASCRGFDVFGSLSAAGVVSNRIGNDSGYLFYLKIDLETMV